MKKETCGSLLRRSHSRRPKVNTSCANPDDHKYVSISGSAHLVTYREKIKELWQPVFKAWFPEGSDQPDVALLKVKIEKAEYWDSPSSTIAQMFSFVSAVVTGKEADLGENRKFNLGAG